MNMYSGKVMILSFALLTGASSLLALPAVAATDTAKYVESAQLSVVGTIDGGAFLLDAEHAVWLKSGTQASAVAPRLIPVLDGDGFAATQAIAPVSATDGALAWTIQTPEAGRYLATLEFRQGRHGNGFKLSVGEQSLAGFAHGTCSRMVLQEVGELDLAKGRQTLTLAGTTALENTWMSVGSVYLRPMAQRSMTRPQIRATIAQHKPRKLPTELLMPGVFSDHMVLQRGMPVPVWGRAPAGTEITVKFGRQTKQSKADADARWMVRLDPMEASTEPTELSIAAAGPESKIQNRKFADVLVGEVWFGSGQSNMEVSGKFLPQQAKPENPYACDEDTKSLLEAGCDPLIRISAVTRDHLKSPAWVALTRDNCLDVPALMSSVAVLLRKKLDVPIGLVIRCESNSTSGIWLSRDAVESDSEIQRQWREYAENEYPKLVADYPEKLKTWEASVTKAKAAGQREPAKPNAPELVGHKFIFDEYGRNYADRISNVIPFAVRGIVWDQGESGTGIAGADQSAVMPALLREWRAGWGRGDLPFIYVDKKCLTPIHREAMAKLPATARVDYQGLSTTLHPPDKAAYARRVFEQIERLVYNQESVAK
jgi:hypothetical protein